MDPEPTLEKSLWLWKNWQNRVWRSSRFNVIGLFFDTVCPLCWGQKLVLNQHEDFRFNCCRIQDLRVRAWLLVYSWVTPDFSAFLLVRLPVEPLGLRPCVLRIGPF